MIYAPAGHDEQFILVEEEGRCSSKTDCPIEFISLILVLFDGAKILSTSFAGLGKILETTSFCVSSLTLLMFDKLEVNVLKVHPLLSLVIA